MKIAKRLWRDESGESSTISLILIATIIALVVGLLAAAIVAYRRGPLARHLPRRFAARQRKRAL